MLSTLQQDLSHLERHLLPMCLELLRGILQIPLLQVVHVIPRKRKKFLNQLLQQKRKQYSHDEEYQ